MLSTKNLILEPKKNPQPLSNSNKEAYRDLLLNNISTEPPEELPKPKSNHIWKHISEIHDEAIQYIVDRRDGKIKSIKTPWSSFNDAGTGGLEWNNIITISGVPGSGKTLILNQITRNAHKLNPTEDFAVLDFQFEMTIKATGIREFSSVVGKTYKELLSVDSKVSQDDLDKIWGHTKRSLGADIYQIETPLTVDQMESVIKQFIAEVKKPTIVTLDHSILIKQGSGEKDKFESLYALGEKLTKLKKELPVMFIILTQMNRSIEDQVRKAPGTIGNYPTRADIFGGESLMQHSDIVIAINRPGIWMEVYGPEQFEVSDRILALHFLKTRNGDNMLCFFEAEFEHMNIREIPTPNRRQLKLRSGSRVTTGIP